jgi:hypothetical protein
MEQDPERIFRSYGANSNTIRKLKEHRIYSAKDIQNSRISIEVLQECGFSEENAIFLKKICDPTWDYKAEGIRFHDPRKDVTLRIEKYDRIVGGGKSGQILGLDLSRDGCNAKVSIIRTAMDPKEREQIDRETKEKEDKREAKRKEKEKKREAKRKEKEEAKKNKGSDEQGSSKPEKRPNFVVKVWKKVVASGNTADEDLKDLLALLKRNGVSENNSDILTKNDVKSIEALANCAQEDLIGWGIKKFLAKGLVFLARNESTGKSSKSQKVFGIVQNGGEINMKSGGIVGICYWNMVNCQLQIVTSGKFVITPQMEKDEMDAFSVARCLINFIDTYLKDRKGISNSFAIACVALAALIREGRTFGYEYMFDTVANTSQFMQVLSENMPDGDPTQEDILKVAWFAMDRRNTYQGEVVSLEKLPSIPDDAMANINEWMHPAV